MRTFTLTVALIGALAIAAVAPSQADAQRYRMYTPGVSYYYSPPVYYATPGVSYYYGPTGTYYSTTPSYRYYYPSYSYSYDPWYTYYPTYTYYYGPRWGWRGWRY
jgi:hypothetical protein